MIWKTLRAFQEVPPERRQYGWTMRDRAIDPASHPLADPWPPRRQEAGFVRDDGVTGGEGVVQGLTS